MASGRSKVVRGSGCLAKLAGNLGFKAMKAASYHSASAVARPGATRWCANSVDEVECRPAVNRQLNWQSPGHCSKEAAGTSFAPGEQMRELGSFSAGGSRRRWCASALALVFLGCLSPTMPMPPPSRPEIDGLDSSGDVVLSGRIKDASYVYADNLTTGYSAGQALEPETGEYRFSIGARVGDSMSLFYRRGNDESQARLFEIPEPDTNTATQSVSDGGDDTDANVSNVSEPSDAGNWSDASVSN